LKVSVIDLGYNSLKLVNYEVERDKSFAAYGQKSILPRVGEGLDETGFLGEQPIKRTIKALKLFREIVDLQQVNHVLPIATSAVREAGNKGQFLRQCLQETGFGFKVLSEKEEAVYSFAGARAALDVHAGLFFDLGGGSLEMVIFENSTIRKILSLPLGGLRLTDLYSKGNGKFTGKNYARMTKRIQELLPQTKDLPSSDKLELVGVGGTVRALARFEQIRDDYPVNKLHNYEMRKNSIESIQQTLKGMTLKEIRKIPAIGQDRARSIIAGSLVVQQLMEALGFRKLTVSTHGVRDGVLSAFLADPASYRKSFLQFVVERVVKYNPAQSPTSRELLESLFSRGILSKRERTILIQASIILPSIPLTNPETLFYDVLQEDSVLSHQDQIIMALATAKSQGMKRADWLQATYQKLLEDDVEEMVDRVASVISLMDILEKTGSSLNLRFLGRRKLRVGVEGGKKHFPSETLKDALDEFHQSFNLNVRMNLP
jgi:exopolyphosphatase / guanosine-5'-triphosphate,3'-diphosphate pyrophosphatase